MSRIDDLLGETLGDAGRPRAPSPDLFERVMDSIEADRVRRRWLAVLTAAALLATGLVAALVLVMQQRLENGERTMPWWTLELVTTAVLVAMALWLGPFIKRFGRAYAADVFHDNPLTGKSYIVLTDIVYYLIFASYILFTARFEPAEEWRTFGGSVPVDVTAAQVGYEVSRVAGILLVIGVLHGLNIVLMPVLGRLFSLNRRLPVDREAPDRR